MPLGLYISVPFCRSKCSYCNFASDVFSHALFRRYVDRVCSDMEGAHEIAEQMAETIVERLEAVEVDGDVFQIDDRAARGGHFNSFNVEDSTLR